MRGYDSDGDGLSDEQERHFCTDPYLYDTNGDTIPDGIDPNPCEPLSVEVQVKEVTRQTGKTEVKATLRIEIKDAAGRWISENAPKVSTTFGTLSPIRSIGTGIFDIDLSSTIDGIAEVTVETTDSHSMPDGRGKETIQIRLTIDNQGTKPPVDSSTPSDIDSLLTEKNFVLESPGVNPGRYQTAGTLRGELWVSAIDGESLDWSDSALKAYPGAFVQVDLADGTSLTGTTNERGWIRFQDSRLVGAVDVTVGAHGARYETWMQVNARVISAPIVKRDILQKDASTQGGRVTGTVRGFWGETGLPTFPQENTNVFGNINIAIVQTGIRNQPLSSMNTGSILLTPDASSPNAEYFEIPPNLVLCNQSDPSLSRFTLNKLQPGKHIVFALAGIGGNIMEASQTPYRLRFTPIAMGFQEIEIKAGESKDILLDLTVDLRTQDVDRGKLQFGAFPDDPQTGRALPMGLVLPLMNTGKGYIFLDVNSAWNFDDFRNPLEIIYPRSIHSSLSSLGLLVHPMVVGLSARAPQAGFDLPGISTLIAHPTISEQHDVSTVFMNERETWLSLPEFILPQPPESLALDAVGGQLYPSRKVAWKADEKTDLTILRFNYMTPPIHNKLLNSDIGASQAHLLWEIMVPAPIREITLPKLSPDAPDYPVLRNYAPTTATDAYQYAEDTIELEINAYKMGPGAYDYNTNFLFSDMNMNSSGVSQDSYLISVANP